jgi:hypothetical protein
MTETNQELDLTTLGEMPHISQATEDAKKAIEKRITQRQEAEQEKKDEEDPKLQETYTFTLDYVDGRGKRWKGEFTNKILTMQDRQTVGALQAQWQLGMAHAAFDPEISGMNYVLAHMAVSLKPGKGANWAKDLRQVTDLDLVQAIYVEVADHEATFHGHKPHQTTRQENG